MSEAAGDKTETASAEAQDALPEDTVTQGDAKEAGVAALKAEVEAMKDKMLRAAAEAENIRKRSMREVEDAAKYGVTSLARDLVSVAENLNRALESVTAEQQQNPIVKAMHDGVDMTLKELLRTFEKHHIRRIDPLGEKFDHNYHQAVMQIDSPDHEAGTIVQVLQAGYVIHDRLLRPAMVGVARQGEVAKKVDTQA